jgi:pyruvate formate lyase activating enzyme
MFDGSGLPIVGLTPFTLQDYPDEAAAILWFTGCNMRCPYCHNPEIVRGQGERLAWIGLERFLRKRRNFLSGVVCSGGECTLATRLPELATFLKSLGFLVKIDTNGSRPAVIENLIQHRFVDFVALDFKAPLANYAETTGWGRVDQWEKTFDLLQKSSIGFELRCTVHPDLTDEARVNTMLKWLAQKNYTGPFYLQHFLPGETLGNLPKPSRRFNLSEVKPPSGITLRLRNFTDYEQAVR